MKNLLYTILFSALALTSFAQDVFTHADGVTITACADFMDGDIYTDSGGQAGDYSNDENATFMICAAAGETVTVTFSFFDVEKFSAASGGTCWDEFTVAGDTGGGDGIYAGDDFSGAGDCLEGTDGTSTVATLGPFTTSVGGCLTFTFESDGSAAQGGWEATLGLSGACGAPPVADVPTIGQWGLMILGLSLLIFGILAVYSRQRATA